VIVLDTHIWVWWGHDAPELPAEYRAIIADHETAGLGVSAISCWEVAKLREMLQSDFPYRALDAEREQYYPERFDRSGSLLGLLTRSPRIPEAAACYA
jgi:PIN domain nuclease of toxin-antitoxin system